MQQAVLGALAISVLVSSWSLPASGEGAKAQCLKSYEQGQRDRKTGAFARAKEAFSFCASSSCPAALHPDCSRWLDEVESATPKVAIEIAGRAGEERDEVSVTVDRGERRALEGPVLPFDPGDHVVVVERPGYRSEERRFTIAEGEKLTLSVALHALVEPEAPPRVRSASVRDRGEPVSVRDRGEPVSVPEQSTTLVPMLVGAGIGVVGAAGFAYFGLSARDGDGALDECAPNCTDREVDAVKRDYLFANISLGVGAAGLLGAGAWALFRPRAPALATNAVARRTLEVRLGPICSLTGRF